jgi:protocatechuate 3,4-dioxygenase beta subunit
VKIFDKVPEGSQPERRYPGYVSTALRNPRQPLVIMPQTLSEITGPVYGDGAVREGDNDLTRQCSGEPQGQRIIVSGRVLDEGGKPVPGALVEVWQANAAGRYRHANDNHPAPLDPNFMGAGRTLTDSAGQYEFVTIQPGAYPWRNHYNAWRPAHIHFSLFGTSFLSRIVTQMYFPGDPLIPNDPVMQAIRDENARARLISAFDMDKTMPEWALAFRFDIVLRGRDATPFENKS